MENQINSLFNCLIDTLKDEIESHTHLLDVIREETKTLGDCRMLEFLDVGVRKGNAFRQSQAAMQRRVDAVNGIIVFFGHEDPISFGELVAYADVTIGGILNSYQKKYADIVRRIKIANNVNRQIIALTLTNVINNIHFIQNITVSLPNYNQYGQIGARNLHGKLVSQAG